MKIVAIVSALLLLPLTSLSQSETFFPVPCGSSIPANLQINSNTFFLTDTKSYGSPVESVAWLCDVCGTFNPQYRYAAVGGSALAGQTESSTQLVVYQVDLEKGSLTPWATNSKSSNAILSVSWCCFNERAYLASGDIDGLVTVYNFDPAADEINRLKVVAVYQRLAPSQGATAAVYAVSWLSTVTLGSTTELPYLAVGGTTSSENTQIELLSFDPKVTEGEPLSLVVGRVFGGTVLSLDWCTWKGQSYLAAGGRPNTAATNGDANVRIYLANPPLQEVISRTPADNGLAFVASVRWCVPSTGDHMCLAIGGTAEGPDDPNVIVACVAGITCNFKSVKFSVNVGGNAHALSWVPVHASCDKPGSALVECEALSIGITGSVGANNIVIYGRNPNTGGTDKLAGTIYDTNISSLAWCSFGAPYQYLLVGSQPTADTDICTPGQEVALYKALLCFRPAASAVVVETPCVVGVRECHKFPCQAYVVNILSWQPVTDAVAYKVYADADKTKLLATISSSAPLVFRDFSASHPMTYYVVAIASSGDESEEAAVVTL